MPPKDPNNPNPLLQLPGGNPMPQPDAMGAQPDATPDPTQAANDVLSGGKIDTPVGPITPPNPQAVQASGGIGGYFKGVLGKLPKALAIMESSYGNPAPLQAIERQEEMQQRGIQQQFENTVTAQRENRAQQLYGVQLKNFQSELQYRQVQTQMQQQKLLDDQHLRHAQEIVENAKNAYGPDAVAAAHRYLISVGQEKPEAEQFITGADGQVYRAPKQAYAGAPMEPAQPVMTSQPAYGSGFTGPVPPGAANATKQIPLMAPQGPKDDVTETFKLGIAQGKYTNDTQGFLQAERDVAQAKHTVDPNAQANRFDARLDRSYQYQNGEIDKIVKPFSDLTPRLSRLVDTLNQRSPQADALVAPELLTVMAGGQGSGLRMNEAEIQRIVGGRSNWESLQAAVNKWKLDPDAARSITAAQDKQIRKLIQAVGDKMMAKKRLEETTRSQLDNANSPEEHRKIVTNFRKQLDQIDEGTFNSLQGDVKKQPLPANFPQ